MILNPSKLMGLCIDRNDKGCIIATFVFIMRL